MSPFRASSKLNGWSETGISSFVVGDLEQEWLAELRLDARGLPAGLRLNLTLPHAILKNARFDGVRVVHHLKSEHREEDDGREKRRERAEHYDRELRHGAKLEFHPGRMARISNLQLAPGARHLAELTVQAPKDAQFREVISTSPRL